MSLRTPDDYKAAFGNAIRLLRGHKGMSQAMLAERIGRDKEAVARIEGGEEDLDLNAVVDLAVKGLGVRFGEVGHLVDQYLGRT
ncbi:MAG TPA: helix-turn-helix transcriptional regulator [Solirubrobacterales bacterium]|nr:helix-turn-helix transcriptional regulator [Solirubrobacterales bacterium]